MGDAVFTALTTQRLVLRRFRPEDLDAFVAYRSDPETARYQSWEAPYRPSQARQFLQELEAIHPDTPGEWFQFAVALRHTDRLIGDCGAHVEAEDSRQAEIGFTLAPSARATATLPRRSAGCCTTCSSSEASIGSAPPATIATRARLPCWSGWACAARATCWRAPGPRASGPTTCSMASCVANGSAPPERRFGIAQASRSLRRRTFTPTPEHEPQQEVAGSSPAKGTSTPTSSAAPPLGRVRHGTAGAATP
jgi:Acetyltransferase (GNAT) domain